jgi:predicted nucleotidyltransferase
LADARLVSAVSALERTLARLRVRHMLIGGIAVAARGVRRLTDDVDATFWADGVDLERLLDQLAHDDVVPRIPDAVAFARKSQVLLLRHGATGVDIDLSLAWLPFESEALDRAERMALGRRRVPVASPDDLIVYKAIAARERDRSDVERLLELHGDRIALPRVRRIVAELAEALERPELAVDLERIVQKVRSRPRPRGRRRRT